MPIDILAKEATGLPDEYVNMAIVYVRFLQSQYHQKLQSGSSRPLGVLSGSFHSISDDFDETPDCFEEYI